MNSLRMRACVVNPTFERFYTWYDNDTVIVWRREMDMYITERNIATLGDFNDLLTDLNIPALGSGRKGRTGENHRKLWED